MKGYVTNIEEDTLSNKDFRRVLYTAKHTQLVLMSLHPKEEIGEEIHTLDQFIRVEAGHGVAILNASSIDFLMVLPWLFRQEQNTMSLTARRMRK